MRTDITFLGALGQQHDPLSLPPHPRRSSGTMTKNLGIRRRVVLHHDIDIGQVEPASGDVRAEENGGLEWGGEVGGEGCEGRRADWGWEVAVQGGKVDVRELGQPTQDLKRNPVRSAEQMKLFLSTRPKHTR